MKDQLKEQIFEALAAIILWFIFCLGMVGIFVLTSSLVHADDKVTMTVTIDIVSATDINGVEVINGAVPQIIGDTVNY